MERRRRKEGRCKESAKSKDTRLCDKGDAERIIRAKHTHTCTHTGTEKGKLVQELRPAILIGCVPKRCKKKQTAVMRWLMDTLWRKMHTKCR